ncbi:22676_t:CDS:1, partial [Gigaspora margarita]
AILCMSSINSPKFPGEVEYGMLNISFTTMFLLVVEFGDK